MIMDLAKQNKNKIGDKSFAECETAINGRHIKYTHLSHIEGIPHELMH